MAVVDFKRKLTAIFSADVEGYSRLMGEDEDGTVLTLTAYRKIMSSLIEKHHGRVVDSPGDNLLAEFGSAREALRCAIEIQRTLKTENDELPEHRRMKFRIGINLGEVIEDGKRIYGDGVNIAARIEGLAEAGGIYISGSIYEQVENKLGIECEFMGKHEVKNISRPVNVYRVQLGDKIDLPMKDKIKKIISGFYGRLILALSITVFITVLVSLAWYVNSRLYAEEDTASPDKMIYPLPEKPSIAVLPFSNISGDSSDDYIAEGITESILYSLEQNSEMFVISEYTMSSYKGITVGAGKVSEDLGVRYVLKGSIQKSGDQIRIMARLIDAVNNGHCIWSDRYQINMKDLFEVQDEITRKVAIALQIELTHGSRARGYAGTKSLQAWEYAVKANRFFTRYMKDDNAKARELYNKAIAEDPQYAFGWASLSWTHIIDAFLNFTSSPAESLTRAAELAQKALSFDADLPHSHSALSFIYLIKGQHEEAVLEGRRALSSSSNDATSHMVLAQTLCFSGNFKEAISLAEKAIRLSPHIPSWYYAILGLSYYMDEKYEESLSSYRKLLEQSNIGEITPVWAHIGLASVCSQLDQNDQARFHIDEILKLDPGFSLDSARNILRFKDVSHQDRIIDSLRNAGLN